METTKLRDFLNKNAVKLYAAQYEPYCHEEQAICNPRHVAPIGTLRGQVAIFPRNNLELSKIVHLNSWDGANEQLIGVHGQCMRYLGMSPDDPAELRECFVISKDYFDSMKVRLHKPPVPPESTYPISNKREAKQILQELMAS